MCVCGGGDGMQSWNANITGKCVNDLIEVSTLN